MKTSWPREFPGVHWFDTKEERAVASVLRGKAPFRYYGVKDPKHVDAFESAARKYYGVKYAHAVNSGTGALMTAVTAMGIGPGDEVIVPAFMWVSTIGAVVTANAIPVLCEIDDTFTMDPADLARKITPRTRLIIPVHMAGMPSDMKSIMAIARKHALAVLEDCAQCNGGSVGGKKVGTFGDVGMFSLQMNKNCTTGEGGLLVTNDQDLFARIQAAHDVGVPWVNGGPDANSRAVTWGSGRRMSELVGAVASVQIRKLPAIVRAMLASKNRIKKQLGDLPGVSFRRAHDPKGDTGPFLVMTLRDAACAQSTRARCAAAGLPCWHLHDYGLHIYYNIPQLVRKTPLSPAGNPWTLPQNARSAYNYARGACPVSDDLFARSVMIPVPSCLTRRQEDWAAKVLRHAVGC